MKRTAMWTRILCAAIMYKLAGCASMAPAEPQRSASYPLAQHQTVALSSARRVDEHAVVLDVVVK